MRGSPTRLVSAHQPQPETGGSGREKTESVVGRGGKKEKLIAWHNNGIKFRKSSQTLI